MEETKEIKINIPKGYEIDEENSTFSCIKFKKRSEVNIWKDINYLTGCTISFDSSLCALGKTRNKNDNVNIFRLKNMRKQHQLQLKFPNLCHIMVEKLLMKSGQMMNGNIPYQQIIKELLIIHLWYILKR